MRWVRAHIAAFGGNGSDVTLFGQSAGANSVINHLVRPASYPMYNKVRSQALMHVVGTSRPITCAPFECIMQVIIQSGAYDSAAVTLKVCY